MDTSAAVNQIYDTFARVAQIVRRIEDPAYGIEKRYNVLVLVLSIEVFPKGGLQYVLLDLLSHLSACGEACLLNVVGWRL